MRLNTERIFGTEEKRLNALFQKLKSEWTMGDAEEYYTMYCGKDAEFVINSSEMIFSEPYKGLPFYAKWIRFMPLTALRSEYEKFLNYGDAVEKKMHPDTASEYAKVLEEFTVRLNYCTNYENVVNAIIDKHPDQMPLLYEFSTAAKRISEGQSVDIGAIANGIDPVVVLATIAAIYLGSESSLESFRDVLKDTILRLAAVKSENDSEFPEAIRESVYISYLAKSDGYAEFVESVKNVDVRLSLKALGSVDVESEYTEMANRVFSDETVLPDAMVDNIVESVLIDDAYYRSTEDSRKESQYNVYCARRAMYEAAFDIMFKEFEVSDTSDPAPDIPVIESMKNLAGVSGDLTVETALMLSVESLAMVDREIAALEYTVDGSPNKIIQKRANMLREGDEPTPKRKNPDDDDDEEIPSTSRVSSADLPDSGNPNSRKPKAAKSGVAGKIQDAAMGAHAASKRASGSIKYAGQKVVNAGKAVLKIPADLVAGLKKALEDFNTMDENRRKAYMVKPGYRKKIFRNLRVAAMYGASAYVGGYMMIITWIGRRLSKEKDRRLRREFSAELATEIEVCKAKIEDATAAGQQKQRYKLMRIQSKLEQEKSRVELNAKYI